MHVYYVYNMYVSVYLLYKNNLSLNKLFMFRSFLPFKLQTVISYIIV